MSAPCSATWPGETPIWGKGAPFGAARPLWARLCHRVVGARDGDDAGNRRKMLFLSWQYLVFSFIAGNLHEQVGKPSVRLLAAAGYLFSALVLGIIPTLVTKELPLWRVHSQLVIVIFCTILSDWWHAAQHRGRVWPLALMVINVWKLISDQRTRLPAVGTILVIVWLILERVEASVLFGLWDSAIFESGTVVALCDCASPPCAAPPEDSINDGIVGVTVLAVDYAMTQMFATEVHKREEVVHSAVMLVQRISVLLADYQTEEAEALVMSTGSAVLPADLRVALRQIAVNQQHYRPYIPDMVLNAARNDDLLGTFATVSNASTRSSGTSDSELRVVASPSSTHSTRFTVLPADADAAATTTPRARRAVRKRSRSLKVQASSGRITLPQLKKRYLTLQCARLQGLRERCLNMSTSALAQATGNFLAGALAACRKCGGMQHSFDDATFIATFGLQAHQCTNSSVDACRCVLILRGLGDDTGDAGAADSAPEGPRAKPGLVLQSVHWGLVLAGEVGTEDSRNISIMGDATARITRLCDYNEEAGTRIVTTEALWGRVQHETWITVRELGLSDGEDALLELRPGAGAEEAVMPYIVGFIAVTRSGRAAVGSAAAAALLVAAVVASAAPRSNSFIVAPRDCNPNFVLSPEVDVSLE